ncbi:unnamed protein product [Malassezia sympodialis ATCC 42132]|uniref:uncharacterized protein n=1 Tax=Malassezia sympodialis (strain ATCC 42132) TaxID=1230383 RepID=UPI0002C23521|nr:uncharacterized protein MSY001_0392 [Malassezia sympodialis ATCC 42132]CCU97686.1 unnamed protein product [Malassezia sympodialis ATCC 42132]|eukprot:XP_018739026.1 uncharacterized protein MSY001_0392 [Malassezia sympodialis ATCC 42132]
MRLPIISPARDTSVGVDLGCGNGKYLFLRSVLGDAAQDSAASSLVTLGSDRCAPLISAAQRNFPSFDMQRLHEKDYALSIATIHHFSTPERRMKSIQELIRLIQPVDDDSPTPMPVPTVPDRPGRGRFMVYVWAFEQRGGGRRLFDEQLEHYQDDAAAQDVLVPWIIICSASTS